MQQRSRTFVGGERHPGGHQVAPITDSSTEEVFASMLERGYYAALTVFSDVEPRKQSRIGREFGGWGLDEFLEVKAIRR